MEGGGTWLDYAWAFGRTIGDLIVGIIGNESTLHNSHDGIARMRTTLPSMPSFAEMEEDGALMIDGGIVLGVGGFTRVLHGRYLGREVAIKSFNRLALNVDGDGISYMMGYGMGYDNGGDGGEEERTWREMFDVFKAEVECFMYIQAQGGHENIVTFYGASKCLKETGYAAIILELCQNSLKEIIERNLWTLKQLQRAFLQIARAVEWLHSRPTKVIHRDLVCMVPLLWFRSALPPIAEMLQHSHRAKWPSQVGRLWAGETQAWIAIPSTWGVGAIPISYGFVEALWNGCMDRARNPQRIRGAAAILRSQRRVLVWRNHAGSSLPRKVHGKPR